MDTVETCCSSGFYLDLDTGLNHLVWHLSAVKVDIRQVCGFEWLQTFFTSEKVLRLRDSVASKLTSRIHAGTTLKTALMGRFTRKVGLSLVVMALIISVRGFLWAIVPLAAGALLLTVDELWLRWRKTRLDAVWGDGDCRGACADPPISLRWCYLCR